MKGQVWKPKRGIFDAEVLEEPRRRDDGVLVVKVRKFGVGTKEHVIDVTTRTLRGDYECPASTT